jgi:hypothetical protein
MTARECSDFPIRLADFYYFEVLAIFFFLRKIFVTALNLVSYQRSLRYVGKYLDHYQGFPGFALSKPLRPSTFSSPIFCPNLRIHLVRCAISHGNRNVITIFCALSRLLSRRGVPVRSPYIFLLLFGL